MKTISLLLLLPLLTPSLRAQDLHGPGPLLTRERPERTSENDIEFGVVLDVDGTLLDADEGEDGADFSLRIFELTANAWIDENTWGYAVVAAEEDEVEIDEAAVHYVGLGEHTELRAGRFFADFGTEMQAHRHDLPYPDRPLPLRTYLGDELVGTGVQLDNWFKTGERSGVRVSLGAFGELASEGEAGPASLVLEDDQEQNDLAFTARAAVVAQVGAHGALQAGASWRGLTGFDVERDGSVAQDLSNDVLGLDLTYGVESHDQGSSWTVGAEYLVFDGDIAATPNGATLDVLDDDVAGAFVWAERGWSNGAHAVGLLWGDAELPEIDAPSADEITLYYTRQLSASSRLRFALTQLDLEAGGDSTRFLIQFTNFLGAHAHEHGAAGH